jgi:hypothetical protein
MPHAVLLSIAIGNGIVLAIHCMIECKNLATYFDHKKGFRPKYI